MPQLITTPWFLIMLLTWTALMFIYLNKTINSNLPNIPFQKENKMKTASSWTWPWS